MAQGELKARCRFRSLRASLASLQEELEAVPRAGSLLWAYIRQKTSAAPKGVYCGAESGRGKSMLMEPCF